MLLARLALAPGRPINTETLIDDLWGEQPPDGATAALQAVVSRLRRALGDAGSVDLVAGGYRLGVRAQDVDAQHFEDLVTQGRRALSDDRAKEAAAHLHAALKLWQGEALADVQVAPFASDAAHRLDELRTAALEDRFDAELQLGRQTEIMPDLAKASAQHPTRERLAGLRMRALAAVGQQSEALAAYEEIRTRLSDELGVDPSRELQETQLALLRGELNHPVAQKHAVPSRLPAQLTRFVGRETELRSLAALIDTSRLVTIVGSGGVGKTRLSLEAVGSGTLPQQRVWFVSLASVTVPDQLADAVLGTLGGLNGSARPQLGEPIERISELLDVGAAILVLDNCEHLVEEAAELAGQLLERLPELRVLATSREPLAITGESLCHVGPLELPSDQAGPADALESAAVQLFADRAASVRPNFHLDESTVQPVVKICSRLDGMPLALELAAAKLRSMSIDQLSERLDDRFRLLTSGSRTALPRQRSLLAVIEWSWDLLDEPERVLARRLSVFPGGAKLDALESVCADDSLPAEGILYVVGSLVEKSILQHDGDRYRMLETIRAYAAERHAEAADEVHARFAHHFLALAEEHEPLLRTRDQLNALAVFDDEHDNLRSALRHFIDAQDAPTAARFVRSMFWYWQLKGMSTLVATSTADVLKFGKLLPEHVHAALGVVQTAAGLLPSSHDIGARVGGPQPAMDLDLPEAMDFHPSLPMLRILQSPNTADRTNLVQETLRSPDPWVRASAMWAHDLCRVEQGDLTTGAQDRLLALRGFEEAGDRWGVVLCLGRLSRDHELQADYQASVAAAERAVAVSSELGSEALTALALGRLARARMNSGDVGGAQSDIRAAIPQARRRGHRRALVVLLSYLSIAHRLSGDIQQADRELDRLETIAQQRPVLTSAIATSQDLRMVNRLAERSAEAARELWPAVAADILDDFANASAWAAELYGWLLALEGDHRGAAEAFGMSEVIRGAFDHGDPELRNVIAVLTEILGEDGYRDAFQSGASLPRKDALQWLADQADLRR